MRAIPNPSATEPLDPPSSTQETEDLTKKGKGVVSIFAPVIYSISSGCRITVEQMQFITSSRIPLRARMAALKRVQSITSAT
jgi:hypothetical protein